jgi:hypothetical protein
LAAPVHFYLDENVPIAIAVQLQRRGIAAVTVRDLRLLGESDINHLQRASAMGYVLCTHDVDYLALANEGVGHAGIVFGQQHRHSVGDWVRFLELLFAVVDAEEMVNRVEYV